MNPKFTPPNFLRLDEERVLVEQLRLLLAHVVNSAIPAVLLAIVLVWTLSNDSNVVAIRAWCAAAVLSKLFNAYYARRTLASGFSCEQAPRLAWTLIALHSIEGAAWGALAWVTLDTASLAGSILVVSATAAIAGSSMSAFSPVLPLYLAFSTSVMLVLASKLLLMDGLSYRSMGMMAALYSPMLYMQARDSAAAVRTAIELRFKNIELIGRLREEAERAKAAHQENIELVARLRAETEKAQAAHLEAEQANLTKSKFLAAASHDLRQPIHAQSLFLEVLARTELNPRQRALLANARAASEASGELLNELLDFSRIEAGVIEPQVQAFRLQPLLHKIENELAPQANAKDLVYRTRETEAAVQSDPVLVELILRNLISNAIRYTEHGGVLVACRLRGDHVALEVWDTGIGIAPEEQQEVFREFHQLGNPERDRHKGLGLGLAIVKGLADRLGHPLSLASTLQRGSVFKLALPAATGCVIEHAAHMQSHPRILNARVLVIDDDSTVREGMLHLLNDWGCECEAVESIEEALALASLNTPDVIVSDYRLREQRTGVEAIGALRAALGRDIPALLITGDTAPNRLREAQASGIPLMHKPVSPGKLYRKLVELIQP